MLGDNGIDLQDENSLGCNKYFSAQNCFHFGSSLRLASLQLIWADTSALTEVVVVFWLPGVADLLDVDVGGSGWNPHHGVVT